MCARDARGPASFRAPARVRAPLWAAALGDPSAASVPRRSAPAPPERGPGAAHVAARAVGHVGLGGGTVSPRLPSRQFGLIRAPRGPISPLGARPRRLKPSRHLPRRFSAPCRCQKPRDLRASRARLPSAWRPRTRPGRRRPPSPPRRARAPQKAGRGAVLAWPKPLTLASFTMMAECVAGEWRR